MPKCATCGHSGSKHGIHYCSAREVLGGGPSVLCGCLVFRYQMPAPVSVRRSPIARSSAPKSKTKLWPKCKNCAHPAAKHHCHYGPKCCYVGQQKSEHGPECQRCEACPGYEPARGIRQKRRTPAAAAKLLADGLWSKLVHARPGACEIQEYHRHVCDGGFQAMHGIPRTFGATRHLLINGFKGCADAHMFFTKRPEAWSAVLLEAWGLETFRELWALARASKPVDMDATVASLRAEAAARGIE